MTYYDYLNSFNRWLESNALPGNAQLMYFKLLNVFNRAGWPESVQVDTLRLMQMTDTADKRTVYRARDRPAEAGLISFNKGTKGHPTRFSLIESIFCVEYGTKNSTKNSTTNGTHIKNKNNNKTKKNNNSPVKSYELKDIEELAGLRLPDHL